MAKYLNCVFGEEKSTYQRGEDVSAFKVTYRYIPSILSIISLSQPAQHCHRRQAERSYTRCTYWPVPGSEMVVKSRSGKRKCEKRAGAGESLYAFF